MAKTTKTQKGKYYRVLTLGTMEENPNLLTLAEVREWMRATERTFGRKMGFEIVEVTEKLVTLNYQSEYDEEGLLSWID